jgi:hypothetical protein
LVIGTLLSLATIKIATINSPVIADIIDLRDLLIGYDHTSNLSDFVTAVADGANTKLIIDHDGTGALNNLVSIVVTHAFTADLLGELITNGNLVLE